jgi:hypothetical protein
MEYGRRSLVTGSSTRCPVLEKPVLAVACCVDNDVYVVAGFNCSLVRERERVSLSLHITPPPAKMFAYVLKRVGKRTWRPERVVGVAGGGGGGTVGGTVLAGYTSEVVFLQSASFSM